MTDYIRLPAINTRAPRAAGHVHFSVSREQCVTCTNAASKDGWCRRCFNLYGNEAWSQVGKRPTRKVPR